MMRSASRIAGVLLPVLMACADTAANQEPTHAPVPAPPAETAVAGSEDSAYRLLAARRTSTLELELNAAAEAGFRIVTVTWGEAPILVTHPGDRNETMILLERADRSQRYSYRVIAAAREDNLEAALNEAGAEGFHVRAVARRVIILERDEAAAAVPIEYRVVTTTRVSTLEAEIAAAAGAGYAPVGIRPPYPIEGLVAILSRTRSDMTPATTR